MIDMHLIFIVCRSTLQGECPRDVCGIEHAFDMQSRGNARGDLHRVNVA